MTAAEIARKSHFTSFTWDDPLRLDAQLTEDERAIRDMHSYELPAIYAVAFEHISQAYGDWIEASIA